MYSRITKQQFFTAFILLLGMLFSLAVLSGCSGSRKTSTSEYVGVELSGLNGEGEVSLTFDTGKLIAFILEKRNMTERELEELQNLLKDPEKDFSLSKKTGLSNGDEVEITGGFEKDFLKKYEIVLQNDTLKYTVEGLLDKTEIHLNDYVRVSFSGFDGEAAASLTMDNAALKKDILAVAESLKTAGATTSEAPAAGEGESQAEGAGGEDAEASVQAVDDWLSGLYINPSTLILLSDGEEIEAEIKMASDRIMQYGIVFTADEIKEKTVAVPVETIKLEDYLGIEFSGFDTMGTAEAVFDREKLQKDLEQAFTADKRGAYGFLKDGESVSEAAETAAVTISDYLRQFYFNSLSQSADISNGTEVTVARRFYDEGTTEYRISQIGIVLVDGEKTFTAEGLPESMEVSLNDYLSATFLGFDGRATADIVLDREGLTAEVTRLKKERNPELSDVPDEEFDNSDLDSLLWGFSVNPSHFSGLSQGDEISAEVSLRDDRLEDFGIIFRTEDITAEAVTIPIETLELNDYLEAAFKGYDEMGFATVYLDSDSLTKDLEEKFAADGRGAYALLSEDRDVRTEAEAAAEEINRALNNLYNITAGDYTDLRNGMGIRLKSDCRYSDESTYEIESVGIILKEADKQVEVSGLKENTPISLNDYVRMEVTGFDRLAAAALTLDTEALCDRILSLKQEQNPGAAVSADDLNRVLRGTSISPNRFENVKTGDFVEASIAMDVYKLPDCGVLFTYGPIKEEVTALPLETIDLTHYFKVSFSGYDGVGSASWLFARTALQRDLQKLFEEHGRGAYGPVTEETDLAAEAKEAAELIDNRIRWDYSTGIDRTEGLSKGETVRFTCIADWHSEGFSEGERLYTDIGIVLKDSDSEIPVIGLKDPQEVDLTDALTVTFEGILPNITVTRTIDETLPFAAGSNIRNAAGTEKIHGKNGDKYTGTIEYDPVDYLKRGFKVTNAYYSYEISGIPFYSLTIENEEDPRIAPLSEEVYALLKERREAGTLRDLALAEDGGTVIWSDTHTAPEEVTEALYETEDSAGNTLYLAYHTVIPVRMSDMSIRKKDVYEVMSTRNILESTDGTLTAQNDWSYRVYGSKEEAEEGISRDCESNYGSEAKIKSIALDTAEALEIRVQSLREITGEAYVDELNMKAVPDAALAGEAVRTAAADGHVYYRFDNLSGYEDAEAFCEANGGHLLTLQTEKENLAVRYLLEDQESDYYWIGGKETEYEGVYAWTTGEPFAWEKWEDGAPDNYTGDTEEGEYLLGVRLDWEDCVINDLSDETEYGFIMETEPAEAALGWTELADAARIRSYGTSLYDRVDDPYGNIYFRSIALNTRENAVTDYRLDGKYSLLSATLSTEADTDSEALMSVCIWGDGELLFSQYDYTKTDAPVSFTINVEGVKRLSVQAGNTRDGGRLFLNNAVLKEASSDGENEEEGSEETAAGYSRLLVELPAAEASDCTADESAGMRRNAEGAYIPDAIDFDTGYAARYTVILAGEYTRFTAELASLSVPRNGAEANVYLYGDGNLLYSCEGLTAEMPAEAIDLDVTGIEVLDIRTDAGENGIGQVLRLGRTALVPAGPEKEQAIIPVPEFPELPEEYAGLLANSLVYENHLYVRVDESLSYSAADTRWADRMGGRLAMPQSPKENEAIRELISSGLHETFWLGAKTSGSDPGTWTWLDGNPVDGYTNWRSGQPYNDEENESLLEIDRDGYWNSAEPDQKTGCVIEFEALSEPRESGDSFSDLEQLSGEALESAGVRLPGEPDRYFPQGIRIYARNNGYVSYLLNGEYSVFHAYLMPGDMAENSLARMAVFGDGRLLSQEEEINAFSGIKELSIDVSGVNELVIRTGLIKDEGNAAIVLFGESFTRVGSRSGEEIARTGEQIVIDSMNTSADSGLFVDAMSIPHDGYLALRADGEAYILYNIAGNFETFSGTVSAGSDTSPDGTVTVRILLDGEEAFVLEDYGRLTGSVPFSLDVAGVQTLRIEAQGEGGYSWVYITDDRLTQTSGRRRNSPSFE